MSLSTQPSTRPRLYLAFIIAVLFTLPFVLPSEHFVVRRSERVGETVSESTKTSSEAPLHLALPDNVKKLHINIGPNTSPILPPADEPDVAVLAVEPNIAIAHLLRETYQKDKQAFRFFVINCAIAGPPLAGHISTFHHYNRDGVSSSLAPVVEKDGKVPFFADRKSYSPSSTFGPGPAAVDFVPVLSLEALLSGVSPEVEVEYLKTDTQGFDLAVIRSAGRETLRRVRRIMTETYLPGVEKARYEGVQNDLFKDWMPYMESVGYTLTNPTNESNKEYDAVWLRKD